VLRKDRCCVLGVAGRAVRAEKIKIDLKALSLLFFLSTQHAAPLFLVTIVTIVTALTALCAAGNKPGE